MIVDLLIPRLLAPGPRWEWRLSEGHDPWWQLGVVVRRRISSVDIYDFLPAWRVSPEFVRDVDPGIFCIAMQGIIQKAIEKNW